MAIYEGSDASGSHAVMELDTPISLAKGAGWLNTDAEDTAYCASVPPVVDMVCR